MGWVRIKATEVKPDDTIREIGDDESEYVVDVEENPKYGLLCFTIESIDFPGMTGVTCVSKSDFIERWEEPK
jgi:hypothetical protein